MPLQLHKSLQPSPHLTFIYIYIYSQKKDNIYSMEASHTPFVTYDAVAVTKGLVS